VHAGDVIKGYRHKYGTGTGTGADGGTLHAGRHRSTGGAYRSAGPGRDGADSEAGWDRDTDPSIFSSDPNEPKYCTCRRVSFGRMVACENPDCTVEWFHFGCVGLDLFAEVSDGDSGRDRGRIGTRRCLFF
jgi:hypothetical protein